MIENRQNGNNQPVLPKSRQRYSVPLIILAALFIIVPFLTWYLTWFGRSLSDEDIAGYLSDEKNPRHVQHALSQIAERIDNHDPKVKRFYPQVVTLSKSSIGEVRKTTAWVMGQDNTSEEFHQALLSLLSDSEPLVRRNAALQLVRFGDSGGRQELRAMLSPFEVKSSLSGTLVSLLLPAAKVRAGGLLARIRDQSGTVQEFRSPLDGTIQSAAVKEGDAVTIGEVLVLLAPDEATVTDALQAMSYVGSMEDLPLIENYSKTGNSSEIGRQASIAVKMINVRNISSK